MARIFGYYTAKSAPLPYQVGVANNIQRYGVKAVTGRDTLSARELRDLNLAANYDTLMQATLNSGDWGRFAEANPEAVEMLEYAKQQYKDWLESEYGTN